MTSLFGLSGPKFFVWTEHNRSHQPDAASCQPEVHDVAAKDDQAEMIRRRSGRVFIQSMLPFCA